MREQRAEELYRQRRREIYCATDRMFAKLLVCEFLAGLVVAVTVSPYTWTGAYNRPHVHLAAALFIGGALLVFPLYLVRHRPGEPVTRYAVALAQMGYSSLFIHLSGGRIETHFHIFGSLAFLAFYRDWKVLVPATALVAVDHLIRGIYFPISVFGVAAASPWRWLEHAAWVIFEVSFLTRACLFSNREMWQLANQQSLLEASHEDLEHRVAERTADLRMEISQRERVEQEMRELSHRAGMAEVATGVLHNVGNALNSVRVSASAVHNRVRGLRIEGLSRALDMLEEHSSDIPGFLSKDVRGRRLPVYLKGVLAEFATVQTDILAELSRVDEGLEHVNQVVRSQQSYAGVSGTPERIAPRLLCREALNLCSGQLRGVDVEMDLNLGPDIVAERHKILQVLVNLLTNAAQAVGEIPSGERRISVRTVSGAGEVRMTVEDNGRGVPPEHAERIFEMGFTTRSDGHGFGLHHSALLAYESGGRLLLEKPQPGRGAVFTLELPCAD